MTFTFHLDRAIKVLIRTFIYIRYVYFMCTYVTSTVPSMLL